MQTMKKNLMNVNTFAKPALIIFLIALLGLTLSACGLPGSDSPTIQQSSYPTRLGQTQVPFNKTSSQFSPTALITSTPLPTFTSTPTPTLHPMSIAAQREKTYPGSIITVDNELDRGINYSRYYASYLSEGLKIYGLLTIPDGVPPPAGWPAIVFNHGYIPPQEYRATERYVAYVDGLARSQYVVFRIDYRGHDRSEGIANGAYGDPGYTVDVLNAVASLREFPSVNPNSVGMWGHSMGGYLTLRAMVIDKEIRAGVIWAGVVASYPDMLTLWHAPSEQVTPTPPSFARRWRQIWIEEFGSPDDNPQFWQSVSSNTYLSDISGPVQLHHGNADETVPFVFSEILYQQLLDAEIPAELYIYANDNHNLSNSFSLAMSRTIAFFDQYLKND